MLIVDMSSVKLPGEVKQNNLPPACGQPIDGGGSVYQPVSKEWGDDSGLVTKRFFCYMKFLFQRKIAENITLEQGKTLLDADGDVMRGLRKFSET
jgi:hypothetical protein